MQSMEEVPQREESFGLFVEESEALQLSGPQVGLAVARSGRSQVYDEASRMSTFSLLSGIGSAVFGVGLFSLVYFKVYLELFPGGVFLTLLFLGGLWICLAVLAIVLGVMALRRLPKASGHGGKIAQAVIGLSLGIGNLLAALAVFIVLVSVINNPPHSEDSIPGWVV